MSDNNKLYVFNDTETTGLNTWYSQIIQIGSVLSDENFDVIEELARMKGYDNIPTDDFLYGHFFIDETDPQYYLQRFRDKLSGLGFFQHYSNSLQDKKTSNLKIQLVEKKGK